MKIREILFILSLALITTWAFQYFLGVKQQADINIEQAKSGQRFTAPKVPEIQVHKPLNREIDFIDVKPTRKTIITKIETNDVRYEFSNDGASLHRLEFLRNWGGKKSYLTTIFPPNALEKEKSGFLVALNTETPYYFDLIDKKENDDQFILSYKASFNGGTIHKTFTIYKKIHRLDLTLSFVVQGSTESIKPRIFFPSPLISELANEDVISAIVNDEKGNLKILPKNDQLLDSYWANPTLFGTQDRYFVNTMVNDPANFVQRGYYTAVGLNRLDSILEGPTITHDASWNISFYIGPKEDDAMIVIDPRLEQTLNYGWFSFISKPLSKFFLESLDFLKDYVGNYGFAIIILTILIKLLLLPFTYRAEEKMREERHKQQRFQKKLEHLKIKYKNDPQALADARAELVKKDGMPGIAGGCLPMLLQLPVFWALSIILANAIELYRAPFLWIPDLSSADPYYILPILVALSIIMHAPAQDPKQRVSSIIMGLMVGAFFVNFSAGLALYIATSTFIGVAQSFIVKRIRA